MRCLIFGKGGMSAGIKEALFEHEVVELDRIDCDVRDPFMVRTAIDRYEPHVIVNCAGVSNERAPLETFDVNLAGAYHIARAAGQTLCILIASVAGLYGKPDHTAYCASKAGVISLVQSLGFTQPIWAISPGRVDTPMRERDYPNDTPGSRIEPSVIGEVVADIMDGAWEPGTNVIVRIEGNYETGRRITVEQEENPWRERLRVGLPVTI